MTSISLELISLLLFSRGVSHATTPDNHRNHCSNGRVVWTQCSPNIHDTIQHTSNVHDSVRNTSRQLKRVRFRLTCSKGPRCDTHREVSHACFDSHVMSSNVARARVHHPCVRILSLPDEPNTVASGYVASLVLQ
jgi:hypothetical protein